MEKELNIIIQANPFRNEESHDQPGYSTTLPSDRETFIYEKYLIENFSSELNIFKGESRQALKDYICKQISLCEQDIEQSIELEKIYDDIIYRRSHHEEFWKAIVAVCFLDPLRINQKKAINRYRNLLSQFSSKNISQTGVTSVEIVRAKEHDIRNLIDFKHYNAHCIFHIEKTPSLHYYDKTNTIHCFGCGKSADAIDVYRHLNNCSFVEAVRALNK